ncbi:MAG: UDP-N-acetylmuramoyl-L-alanyl-D-glutamate--2,6-diaminopimelate ligase [Deltaproteobacteria bacterium]|nr:UDP-N-acetylmuramoyl-L-alanyl-D-glutamate--2,6-diaminopimelate ligase [Deltaproteobacteria bacterium]
MAGIEVLERRGPAQVEVSGLAYDSRTMEPGAVFFALKGSRTDGRLFIDQALSQGAAAIIVQDELGPSPDMEGVALIRVADARQALAQAAHAFYHQPSQRLKLIGLTGTSGKTTTTYALESIFKAAGLNVGVVGTVNYRFGGRELAASVTTPQSSDLARLLALMAAEGVEAAMLEVSSHALDQSRVAGCRFEVVGFTNLSRDHLDYHSDMESYFQAKRRLFTEFESAGRAAVNIDDPYGRRLKDELAEAALTYGLGSGAEVTAQKVNLNGTGIRAEIITPAGRIELASPLLGRFNLSNLLCAAALAFEAGIRPEAVASGLKGLKSVPGRMEEVGRPFGRRVIVDYCHKVEALEQALSEARNLTPGRLVTVLGCGGDRDRGKRPLMGRVAAQKSDVVIITSDNPRSEDPVEIMDQIASGLEDQPVRRFSSQETPPGSGLYTLLEDRRAAIRLAIETAGEKDTVIICGKGHENYQIVGHERLHLDDREEALAALQRKAAEK